MKAQVPAEGIVQTGNFGDAKFYHVICDCGSDECTHVVHVEADDFGIQVHVYVKNHTRWWEKNRWKQIWHILTRGYAEMETTIVMKEQTALNYAETLKKAIVDVKAAKEKYRAEQK